MKLLTIITALTLICFGSAGAAGLTGKVTDEGGQPIPGSSVVTDVPGIGTATESDGSYELRKADGATRVTISAVGHHSKQFAISELPEVVVLRTAYVRGADILVTAGRAETGISPVAFDNVTADEIERDYAIGDVPMLLETTPNMMSYSYAGGSLGATEYKIRGFDSKRIAVYIDGVPLNDPEDHSTYFVDIPDFAASVTDIQVQRGVGLSMYGDASFGGSINIAAGEVVPERRIVVSTGYGAFTSDGDKVGDMRKQAVEYSSGLVNGRWSFSGRWSKQYSDGYREQSWFDGRAYNFSVSRLDQNMTTTLNLWGGPIKYHMNWYGLTRDQIEETPRLNPTPYENQTDNFDQPHYALHNAYNLSDNATLRNTFFYIRGKGFYEQFKVKRDPAEYNIDADHLIDPSADEIDLVRQKWVTKHQYGWSPRLELTDAKGKATIGGSFYYFESDHWGQIIWAEGINNSLDPRHRYYEYFGQKTMASLFANRYHYLSDRLTALASLQLKYLRYDFDQTQMGAFSEDNDYSLDWLFLSPRLGLTYHLNERTNIHASFAISSHEPNDALIYDATDPDAVPAVENDELTLDNERVYNFELGGNIASERGALGLNLFWMEFKNEVIFSGGLDDDGRATLGNAERSVHAGVELTGSYRLHDMLTVSGNAALSDNKLKEYIAYSEVWDAEGNMSIDTADYSGNTVAGFPEFLANLVLDSRLDPARMVLRFRFVGRQYIENSGDKDLAIDPFMLTSLSASVSLGELADLGRLSLTAHIDNLFDKKYEATGVVDWGTAYYVPGAERNYFVQLKWELE